MIDFADDAITTQTERLIRAGFKLVPLGRGCDGKAASISRWQNVRLGLNDFNQRMQKTQSTMYGVRLDGMVVLDCDVRDQALVMELELRFGTAAVKVQTPRGFHLYYRDEGAPLPTVAGLPVDVKGGSKHYVVGAGSIRPCGGRYIPQCGELGVTTLTPLRQQDAPASTSSSSQEAPARKGSKVVVGRRHSHLKCKAVSFAPKCDTEDELYENLVYVRDEECEEPSSFSNVELRSLANWAFEKHQNGQLYAESGGSFRLSRHFAVMFRCDAEALALLLLLTEQHGHHPHKVFNLSYVAMKREGLTGLSERAFKRALKRLITAGAIIIATNYKVGQRCREYKLGQPLVP